LTRDELQGVVAHEFSHILSGRSSGRGDSRGGLLLLGLGVFVLGLVGAFFGRLIMAAAPKCHASLDHLVRGGWQRQRNGQAERIRGALTVTFKSLIRPFPTEYTQP